MQKKLIALAVAAALTAPAAAMAADVTVYGKAFLNIESVNNDKVVAPAKTSAMRILSDASRFGVKASEDLGDDLKAIFQFEVEVGADGGVAGTNTGMMKSRNSGVGLEGGFGKVIVGIWDTPFKVVHNKVELFDNTTSFSALNIMGRDGGKNLNYNTRDNNLVQYWTPKFAGFQGAVSYKPDAAPQSALGTGDRARMSLSGTYDVDAIYVALGFENRQDVFVGTTDSATRLTARYNFGDLWVGATVENLKVNTSPTANYTHTNTELVGQYTMDKNNIALSYAKAGKSGNVAATSSGGANQVSLRLGHKFSKATEIFAAYTSLKNDAAVAGGTNGGAYGLSSNTAFGPAVASTQSAFGLGMIHSF